MKHLNDNGELASEKDCGEATLCDADNDKCLECITDDQCSGLEDEDAGTVNVCMNNACDYACVAGKVRNAAGDCVSGSVSCSMVGLANDTAYGQVLPMASVDVSTRVSCGSADIAVEKWITLETSFSKKAGSNDEYTADLSALTPGNYNCLFEVSTDGGDSWYACDSASTGWNLANVKLINSSLMMSDVNTSGNSAYTRAN